MSVMRQGRLFEKVGVNFSEVHGTLGPAAIAAMKSRKGRVTDPRFWASGIVWSPICAAPKCRLST